MAASISPFISHASAMLNVLLAAIDLLELEVFFFQISAASSQRFSVYQFIGFFQFQMSRPVIHSVHFNPVWHKKLGKPATCNIGSIKNCI
jgi:hypothetical protein